MTDTIANSRLNGRRVQSLAFSCGTAMLAASAAHAQCADPRTGNGAAQFNPLIPASSVVSGVQSLVSVLTTQNTAFLTQTSGFIGAPANPSENLQGGGVWARGIGGTFDTRTPGNYNIGPSAISGAQSGNCSIRTFQDYAGFQAGADISRLNVAGYNIHTGVTVGYTNSSTQSNGTFRADFQTPFIGLYGAITKGSFFADAQIRWDFFQGVLNDPQNTLFGQRLDARSLSLTGNLGYQFPLADGFFVEPSAGAVYSEAKVDRIQTGGAFFINPFTTPQAPLSIKIRDFDSILARASVRVGKNFIVGDYALQPFITASVINEFGGPVRTDVASNFGDYGSAIGQLNGGGAAGAAVGRAILSPYDSGGRLNTYRIGTYGQFSAGIAGQILNTGWLGYIRGDYRTGDRVDGYGISGGLRYQFNPDAPARALISKDGPTLLPVLEGPVTWTAFSIGGSVGGLWGQTQQVNSAFFINQFPTANPHVAGVYAGGQIGADYQFDRFVVGIAGDAGFTNGHGGSGCASDIGGNFYNCQSNINDLYMATGRVGYAMERALFYAKGGAAFADTTEKQQRNYGIAPLLQAIVPGTYPNSKVHAFSTGWTIGGGFEYAITKNISAKAEYMHFELDRKRYAFGTPVNVAFTQAEHSGDLVKVGVNYRFTFEPPVVAPPPRAVIAKY